MWKAPAVLLIGLSLPSIGGCADFWQTREPASWSDKDVAKIRGDSPWARKAAFRRAEKVETTKITQEPAQTKSGKGGTKLVTKTVTTKKQVPVADVGVRWESGAAMLAATERVDPRLRKAFDQLVPEYYLVSLTGELPFSNPAKGVDELQAAAVLRVGDTEVRPSRVRSLDSGEGLFYLLQFARDGSLESYGKSVDLEVRLGSNHLRVNFDPKKMIFQGKSAL